MRKNIIALSMSALLLATGCSQPAEEPVETTPTATEQTEETASPSTEEGTGETATPSSETPTESETTIEEVEDSGAGIYNGYQLSTSGTEWETFSTDGWNLKEGNGEDGFLEATNDKYPRTEFTVYNHTKSNATKEEIELIGIAGYRIAVTGTSGYPPFSWKGVTFGDTLEDIQAVYGKNAVESEEWMDKTYKYSLDNSTDISFTFRNNSLRSVEMTTYNI